MQSHKNAKLRRSNQAMRRAVRYLVRYRNQARAQRTRAGRIKAAILVYAYALEPLYPDKAMGARGTARGFGELANLLGDEATLDFRSKSQHAQLRRNLADWAREVRCFERQVLPTAELDRITRQTFDDYFQ